MDPVSRCPIWDVTTKIDGINNYNSSDSRLIFEGYCTNDQGLLDPSLTCPLSDKTTPFSKCKNNCKGGNKFRINEGIMTILVPSCLPDRDRWSCSDFLCRDCGNLSVARSSNGRGWRFGTFRHRLEILKKFEKKCHCLILGAASQMMCLGPINCRTPTGQCCALFPLPNGNVVCPVSC